MGGIVSMFGGSKPKSNNQSRAPEVAATTKQQEPEVTSANNTKRRNSRQRSDLVSGRPGAPTRSGINVPGSS